MILQSVRWYLAYALSYRDIEEIMKERGFDVDHSTILRWVVYYAPLLQQKLLLSCSMRWQNSKER
ncbi:MAG: IS6 family transposase, partial [Gammaproteobacteria bacterium]|nr:IS6 family transposase [Gammaproteobacteria bacterium]